MVITNIEACKMAKNRCNIYCDDEFVCALFHDVIVEHRLKTGMEISRDELEKIIRQDEKLKCYANACNLLSVRSRSEREIRDKLKARHYSSDIIDWTINKLIERDYIDDDSFAQEYAEYLLKKGYGAFAIKHKLYEKGIDGIVAENAIDRLPQSSALEAAEEYGKRAYARVLREQDLYKRKNKFYAAMSRHGFGYDLAKEVYAKFCEENEE